MRSLSGCLSKSVTAHRVGLSLLALAWIGLSSSCYKPDAKGIDFRNTARDGDLVKVQSLLKENPRLISSTSETGWAALHCAAARGHRDVAEFLIRNGADVNAKTGEDGSAPLYHAAFHGHADVARLLLANNAEIEAKDHRGMTPLYVAVAKGHLDVVRLLIAAKAEIDARTSAGTRP